jgi:D-alanyl-D-alanine carboxypeptidase
VILGLGQRNRGETISVVEVDGEEQLFYSGYLMRKLGTTELLQRALEAAVESPDTQYPGAVLHVSSSELGTWTGAAGLGDTETNTAMRPHDKFRAGSLTKPFIAVVILQLVEEGLFSLDDPITTVLPESVTSKFADSNQITVRMLLNHTGGLPDFMDLAGPEIVANPTKLWEAEEFLDFAAAQEPWFAPGEAQGYSNTDYILLGMIIEEATGRSWREEMRARVFEPLNLENTLLPEPNDTTIPGDHARGYADFGDGVVDATEIVNASVVGAPGGQSLVTNPEDLARFMTTVLAGELFQKAETLDEMLTFVDWPDGNPLSPYLDGYGLGLMKADFGSGIEGVGHSGDTEGGYHVFVFHLPAQNMTISGAVNAFDHRAGFLLIPRALEVLVPGYSAPELEEEQPAPAGNVYQDPEGRFSITLVGDWTPVETDGTYVQVAYADAPLILSLVTVESDDLEAGVDAVLRQVGLDPAALTETNRSSWDKWDIFLYTLGDGQGVTVLGQTSDGTSYYFVATGPEDLVANPPEDALETIQRFSLSGEQVSLPATVEEFETYVNSFVGTRPPGLSMAIAMGEDVLYEQGFGMADGPRELPATPDTVYQWASVTKTVTAAAIMQLREQGLIDLDAPVSDYLDYFPAEYPITVRHLLTHSSGLPEPADFLLVHLRLKGQPSPDFDSVDREYYEGLPNLMFEPGSQSAYVNPTYVTLGQVVAAVSGQPYVEYVQEHILNPLGMTNTDFTYSNDFMEANAAASAVPAAEAEALVALMDEARGLGDGADFFQETGENNAWLYPYIVGDGAGGALLGPVTEMIRFGQMMLNEGELDGVRILEPESVALLQEVQNSTSGEPLEIGLSWHFGEDAEHPYVEHDGGGTFQTKLRLYMKDGFAVAIMANGSGFDRDELANAAANVVFSIR